MKHLLAALLFLAAGAAVAAEPPEFLRPTKTEVALLVISQALVVADVTETRFILHHRPKLYEENPVLGTHPSDLRLVLTAGAASAATVAIWYNVSPPWRNALTICISSIEFGLVSMNAALIVHGSF